MHAQPSLGHAGVQRMAAKDEEQRSAAAGAGGSRPRSQHWACWSGQPGCVKVRREQPASTTLQPSTLSQLSKQLTSRQPCVRRCALPGACRPALPRLRAGAGWCSRHSASQRAAGQAYRLQTPEPRHPLPGSMDHQGIRWPAGRRGTRGASKLACWCKQRGADTGSCIRCMHAAELVVAGGAGPSAAAERRLPVHMACPTMPPSVTPITSDAAARPARKCG